MFKTRGTREVRILTMSPATQAAIRLRGRRLLPLGGGRWRRRRIVGKARLRCPAVLQWLHRQCVGDVEGGRPGTTNSITAAAKAPMEHCLVTVWFMTFANTHTVCRWLFVAIPRRIIAVALSVGGVGHLGVVADSGDVFMNAMASAFNMGACTSPGVHSARGCLLEQ